MYRSISGVFLFLLAFATSALWRNHPHCFFTEMPITQRFLDVLTVRRLIVGRFAINPVQNGSEFSSYSIWNRFSNFGNALSSYSPWNQFSNAGPIIVDKDGDFYGQLTANKFAIDRTQIQRLNQLTDMVVDVGELEVVRNVFAENKAVSVSAPTHAP